MSHVEVRHLGLASKHHLQVRSHIFSILVPDVILTMSITTSNRGFDECTGVVTFRYAKQHLFARLALFGAMLDQVFSKLLHRHSVLGHALKMDGRPIAVFSFDILFEQSANLQP